MGNSFFLVNIIDKNNFNEIYKLYQCTQSIFTIGRTYYQNENIYVKGIEPIPDIEINSSGYDICSIWLGMDVEPKATLEENIALYDELHDWVRESLFILRFLINLNLKARVFFHVQEFSNEQKDASYTFQEEIDIYCDSSSTFHVRDNKYNLVFPLLIKLLKYRPTDKMKAVMYNHASAKIGNSFVINYFYSFATFEGIFQNWAEVGGFSELWGTNVASIEEQERLHEEIRSHFEQYINNNNNITGEKLNQLNSFKDSVFPRPQDRKIRRSLKQRLKSYFENRLPEELQRNEIILSMFTHFRRIADRRNDIAHSLESYTRAPGILEDTKILMSTIKLIMDFELSNFLRGEIDWKFEEREINLRDHLKPKTQEEVLEKFTFSLVGTEQNIMKLIRKIGDSIEEQSLVRIEFHSAFNCQDEDDNRERTIFQKELKIHFSGMLQPRSDFSEPGIMNIYKYPYWWIFLNQDEFTYVFKTFENNKITHIGTTSIVSKIASKKILSIARVNSMIISEDLALEL